MSTVTRSEPAELTSVELDAWRGLLRAHAGLVKALDAELEATHRLPLTSYEVLLHLASAPERRMRMCELAESVFLSRSGVTRLVDRLERDGHVVRAGCDEDARGAFAVLTDAGARTLRAARVTHIEGVRRHFLSHFSDGELAVLGDFWARVAGGAGDTAPC